MFNNYIYINSNRNEAASPSVILKFLVTVLALIGIYKIVRWTNCLLKVLLRKKQQQRNLKLPKIQRSKHFPYEKGKIRTSRKLNPNYKWSSESDLSDQQENTSGEKLNIGRRNRVLKKIPKPNDDLNNFRKKRLLKTSTSSDSIMGVATAAATAATVFMDRRRHRCCGKCCGKRDRKELF